jgi:hypothetical protein
MTSTPQSPKAHFPALPILALLLPLWAAAIVALAAQGAFAQTPGGPPLPIILAILLPVAVFGALWQVSPGLRGWAATLDPALLAGAQTWRVAGAVFLFVWWLGHLPATFAIVAGLGDIAVGVVALGTATAIARNQPGWQAWSRRLVVLGTADFVTVVTLASLSGPGGPLQGPDGLTAAAMQQLPMILIPGFLVPLFIILHILSWLRSQADLVARAAPMG